MGGHYSSIGTWYQLAKLKYEERKRSENKFKSRNIQNPKSNSDENLETDYWTNCRSNIKDLFSLCTKPEVKDPYYINRNRISKNKTKFVDVSCKEAQKKKQSVSIYTIYERTITKLFYKQKKK